MSAVHALATLLEHPKLWRGDALAGAPVPTLPSGFAALDAALPGQGWPRGGLTELLSTTEGVGELSLLMPALARLSTDELAWLMVVTPPHAFYGPALADAGVALSRLLITQSRGNDAAWACERALETDGVGAVLAWLPEATPAQLRRLHQAAEASQSALFAFRPAACAAQPSPAPLRLQLGSAQNRLQVTVLKRRGAPCLQPILLDIHRPSPLRHALVRPASAAPAARSPAAASPA